MSVHVVGADALAQSVAFGKVMLGNGDGGTSVRVLPVLTTMLVKRGCVGRTSIATEESFDRGVPEAPVAKAVSRTTPFATSAWVTA